MEEAKKTFWDPLGEEITATTFAPQQTALLATLTKYQNNPNLVKTYFIGCCLIPVVTIFLIIFVSFFLNSWNIWLVLAFCAPIFFYYRIKKLEVDTILFILCQKNNWIYNPQKDNKRAQKFDALMPQIFDIGHNQYIDDQIWGTLEEKKTPTVFWRGVFNTSIGSGRSQKNIQEEILIIKLLHTLPVPFMLSRPNIFGSFENNLQTESDNFNKTFKISVAHLDKLTNVQIIKVLSPSIQVRLLDFAAKYSINQIIFQENIMVVVFNNQLWKPKHTNFIKKIEVNQVDENAFYQTLKDIAELPAKMVNFL